MGWYGVVRGGTGWYGVVRGGTGWYGVVVQGGVVRGWYGLVGTGWVVWEEGAEEFSLTFKLSIIRDLYQNRYYST